MNEVLVTGGAGFIGSHLVDQLLDDGVSVTVVDNLDPYYDPEQKRSNVEPYLDHPRFRFEELSIVNGDELAGVGESFDAIVHLAAKCGVRPSLDQPIEYQRVNVQGTVNLLRLAVDWGVDRFVFGSSSSVYGINEDVPWEEGKSTPRPASPYASTKRSGELMGHVYSHTYGLPFVALRFFTVYGARQRPDLAIHKFARKMLRGEAIPLFGDGSTYRDYTHVSDIVDGIVAALDYEGGPYRVFNLGNGEPVTLDDLVGGLESALGVSADRKYLPPQPGDVPRTFAAIERAREELGYVPTTGLREGLRDFADWARTRYADPSIQHA